MPLTRKGYHGTRSCAISREEVVAHMLLSHLSPVNASRLREALACFSKAIQLYPSDAQAHNNRGLTKLKFGDRDGAAADFHRALELEPALNEAAENLKRLTTSQQTPPPP